MLLAAEQTTNTGSPAMTSLVLLLIGSWILISLGLRIARWQRARSDYRKMKESLPPMRRAIRTLFWAVIKLGIVVVIAGAIMTAMAGREARRNVSDHPDSPGPAKTSAVTPTRAR